MNINKKCTFGERTERPDMRQEIIITTNYTIRTLAMNFKKYSEVAKMGNYVRYVSGYAVVDRYGQMSKHYYAGSERVASRLAGQATAFEESEDLEGQQSATLTDRHRKDIRFTLEQWEIGPDNPAFENNPLPELDCEGLEAEELKQCECEQTGTCEQVIYWYHPDHLGSSSFLTDAAGQPYQFVLYLPFGETFAEDRAAGYATPYRFNAKELDEETGLYYYGARYYDPRVSMWWGVDPLADKYPEYSPYTYTLNNPVRYIDPDGRVVVPADKKAREFLTKYIEDNFGMNSGFSVGRNKIKFNKKKFESAGFQGKQLELANRLKEVVTNKKHKAYFSVGQEGSSFNTLDDGRVLETSSENEVVGGLTKTTELDGKILPNLMVIIDPSHEGDMLFEDIKGQPLGMEVNSATTHELLGHTYDFMKKTGMDSAVEIENIHRELLNLEQRSGKNHTDVIFE